VTFIILGPTRWGRMNDDCNILVLRCIGCVEPSRVVIMTSKTMVKLGFGIGITPYLGDSRWFFL
jgi:hypothetical protein